MRRALITGCLALNMASLVAADRLAVLLANDPVADAERAFTSGDHRHIVLPVCGKESGEVIPGWPLEYSPEAQRAMDQGRRPLSCADFGDDSQKAKFVRAANYAERYNRKILELESKGKK